MKMDSGSSSVYRAVDILVSLKYEANYFIYYIFYNYYLVVFQIDPDEMRIEQSWTICVKHNDFEKMFIMCGVLYGIQDVKGQLKTVNFSLDLYTDTIIRDLDIEFDAKLEEVRFLQYNPVSKVNL